MVEARVAVVGEAVKAVSVVDLAVLHRSIHAVVELYQ